MNKLVGIMVMKIVMVVMTKKIVVVVALGCYSLYLQLMSLTIVVCHKEVECTN